jgi:transposase InsO family protein
MVKVGKEAIPRLNGDRCTKSDLKALLDAEGYTYTLAITDKSIMINARKCERIGTSKWQANVIIETWRRQCNEVRPHSSLGYLTPNEFVTRLPTQRPVMRARTLRCAGLRALARCTTRSARSTCRKHGRHLKLTVVRRIRAGQMSAGRDFVHDQFACGRRFRILNSVDDVTRECLVAIPDTSLSGKRAARDVTMLIERRGKPRMIVSDNGTEFTSNAALHWS